MSIAAERLVANVPGRMESQSARRVLAQPLCTLQEPHPEEFHNTMCDAAHHEYRKLKTRCDEETFELNLAFMRAHGLPRGEITTFSNAGAVALRTRCGS